jgi:hypothetical protein
MRAVSDEMVLTLSAAGTDASGAILRTIEALS